MSTKYSSINNLKVSEKLLTFVNNELLKDLNISPDEFWIGFDNQRKCDCWKINSCWNR